VDIQTLTAIALNRADEICGTTLNKIYIERPGLSIRGNTIPSATYRVQTPLLDIGSCLSAGA
jgi:hypothetical protein